MHTHKHISHSSSTSLQFLNFYKQPTTSTLKSKKKKKKNLATYMSPLVVSSVLLAAVARDFKQLHFT